MSKDRYIPYELSVLTPKTFSYKSLMKVWDTQPRDINASLHHEFRDMHITSVVLSHQVRDGSASRIDSPGHFINSM